MERRRVLGVEVIGGATAPLTERPTLDLMQISSRVVAAAAFGLVPLLLMAGCGSTSADGARATITPIQGSSYVTIAPATTTTTTTIAGADLQAGDVSPVEQTYTVVSGDSLSKIASLYDITVDVLVNYNAWSDGSSHLILPGDKILIPPDSPVAGSSGAEVASGDSGSSGGSTESDTSGEEETAAGQGCQHTIVEGDNPTRVASKYDITVDELANANLNNAVYQTFLIGSQLTIPPGGSC